jgi:hypothetical protein
MSGYPQIIGLNEYKNLIIGKKDIKDIENGKKTRVF